MKKHNLSPLKTFSLKERCKCNEIIRLMAFRGLKMAKKINLKESIDLGIKQPKIAFKIALVYCVTKTSIIKQFQILTNKIKR